MRIFSCLLAVGLVSTLALSACAPKPPADQTYEALRAQESEKLNDWFEARYNDELARSPMTRTYWSDASGQSSLDDVSRLARDENAALQEAWLKEMRESFDIDRLDENSRLSYRLYAFMAEDALAMHALSGHDYVFTPMSGPHISLPAFMINHHRVETAADAKAYVERLEAFGTYLGHYAERAEAQFEQGIMLPAFIYPELIEVCRDIITGAPFTSGGDDSPLWEDFVSKITGLNAQEQIKLDAETAQTGAHEDSVAEELLMIDAAAAMRETVQPAYENLIAMFERHYAAANNEAGVWKLPDGEAYYAARLQHYTTTGLTADDIHNIGLAEVERIQGEMREIMQALGFEGTLQEFFTDLRTNPQWTHPNDDAGRERYARVAAAVIDTMKSRLGDHMQITVVKDLVGLPKFRTHSRFAAYNEGWALYAQNLPKALGLYTDPYQDFGRLSMDITRAAGMVVDTGIHAKQWTPRQAANYLIANTAQSETSIRADIVRYAAHPGEAAAGTIGKLKIVELREKAETAMGDEFDIRAFHDVILTSGPVPLSVLEELVDGWIKERIQK